MSRSIPYIDRLAQAQWFERFGFVAVAAFGCIGIVVAKVVGVPALAVTIAAVLLMLAYGALMWRAVVGRVRADQAGDNLYYLGLLYTLSGLAYAIFTFRPEETSNAIVEGFGIALATTIVGLMLRVFFNQVRLDLVEVEERARMDLAQAATELKAELNQIAIEMNDFGRQTRQSLAEAVSGVEAGMINSVKEAGVGLAKLSSTAEEKVSAAFSRLDNRAEELSESATNVCTAVDETASKVRALSQNLEEVSPRLVAFAEAGDQARRTGEDLARHMELARGTQEALAATGSELRQQVSSVASILESLTTGLESSLAAQDQRLEELKAAPVMAGEQVGILLRDLQDRIQAQLGEAAQASTEAIKAQLSALEAAVETMRDFNRALAAELQQSRGSVASVQGSLVSAVDQLTRHVEAGRTQ